MPIYEYVCNACGHEFEEWQKITDAPVQKCPSCGKRKVDRLVSLSAFHLKGSGWYVTDYGKRGSSSESSSKTAKSAKSGGDSGKTESSGTSTTTPTSSTGSDTAKTS